MEENVSSKKISPLDHHSFIKSMNKKYKCVLQLFIIKLYVFLPQSVLLPPCPFKVKFMLVVVFWVQITR